MIDENIDKKWKEHLIIYDTFLGNFQDIGSLKTSFLKFLSFFNDTSQVVFHVISNFFTFLRFGYPKDGSHSHGWCFFYDWVMKWFGHKIEIWTLIIFFLIVKHIEMSC